LGWEQRPGIKQFCASRGGDRIPCYNAGNDHRQAGTNAAALFGDFYGNPGKFNYHSLAEIRDADNMKNTIDGMCRAQLQDMDGG